jgi:hypothetical protein
MFRTIFGKVPFCTPFLFDHQISFHRHQFDLDVQFLHMMAVDIVTLGFSLLKVYQVDVSLVLATLLECDS